MPGWGSWGGTNLKLRSRRTRRRMFVKLPEVPRKDSKKEYVIINEDPVPKLREQLVNLLILPWIVIAIITIMSIISELR